MPATADRLRGSLERWGTRVIATAARNAVQSATGDQRVITAPDKPARAPARPRPHGRVVNATSNASQATARIRIDTFGWVWKSSASPRPFAPREHHQQLAGHRFGTWRDPRLANRTQAWLPVTHFFPGDHKGCLCQTPTSPAPPDREVWGRVLPEHYRRAIRAAVRSVPL